MNKMSDYLPQLPVELIQEILLKLPIKPLLKCTSVCKSWNSLVKSPSFIQTHLSASVQNPLLLSSDRLLSSSYQQWLLRDSLERYSKLVSPRILNENGYRLYDLSVVGTSNGLVCLDSAQYGGLFIWNPCIRKLVTVSNPPSTTTIVAGVTFNHKCIEHGFGYEPHSNDFKILRIVTLRPDRGHKLGFATKVQVYSLASGIWRNLSASDVPPDLQASLAIFPCRPTYFNGYMHMLQKHKVTKEFFILTFDLATELFGEIAPPMPKRIFGLIRKYGNSLAFVNHKQFKKSLANRFIGLEVWVMKQYGVADSWTLLFDLDMTWAWQRIYGFRSCGELVMGRRITMDDNDYTEVVSVDPNSKEAEIFVNEYLDYDLEIQFEYFFLDSFVESLVLLDHANALPYRAIEEE